MPADGAVPEDRAARGPRRPSTKRTDCSAIDGLLSVYGNNATLARGVGDRVSRADVIAEVGNTGGMTQPGLYFELRYRGRAVDPLQWIAAR